MAESVNSVSAAEERRELEQFVPPLSRPRGQVYAGRFTLAYLVLVLFFGAVAAAATYLAVRDDPQPWAPFEPRGEGLARASSIAGHVAPRYRVDDDQIAIVDAQPPFVQSVPVETIAIARDPSRDGVGGGFQAVASAEDTLFYVFCGLDQGCTVRGAGPTEDVGPLLRREALELALYTFKYMEDVDGIVALLPPTANESPAIWLRRRALEPYLDRPLEETLPGSGPFTAATVTAKATVDRLTLPRMFPSRFEQLPNGRAMLILGGPQEEQGAAQSG